MFFKSSLNKWRFSTSLTPEICKPYVHCQIQFDTKHSYPSWIKYITEMIPQSYISISQASSNLWRSFPPVVINFIVALTIKQGIWGKVGIQHLLNILAFIGHKLFVFNHWLGKSWKLKMGVDIINGMPVGLSFLKEKHIPVKLLNF